MSKPLTTIQIGITETFTTTVIREKLTITVSDYPELEGLSEEEIQDYLIVNATALIAKDGTSLWAKMEAMNVVSERVTDEDTEVYF